MVWLGALLRSVAYLVVLVVAIRRRSALAAAAMASGVVLANARALALPQPIPMLCAFLTGALVCVLALRYMDRCRDASKPDRVNTEGKEDPRGF